MVKNGSQHVIFVHFGPFWALNWAPLSPILLPTCPARSGQQSYGFNSFWPVGLKHPPCETTVLCSITLVLKGGSGGAFRKSVLDWYFFGKTSILGYLWKGNCLNIKNILRLISILRGIRSQIWHISDLFMDKIQPPSAVYLWLEPNKQTSETDVVATQWAYRPLSAHGPIRPDHNPQSQCTQISWLWGFWAGRGRWCHQNFVFKICCI